jgi:hypothetical protein
VQIAAISIFVSGSCHVGPIANAASIRRTGVQLLLIGGINLLIWDIPDVVLTAAERLSSLDKVPTCRELGLAGCKPCTDVATVLAVSQKRSQRIGDALWRTGAESLSPMANEGDDICWTKCLQADRVLPVTPYQELARCPRMALDRDRRDALIAL